MAGFYLVPKWFFGIDVGLEILFAIVTLIVALNAFRLYKISRQKDFELFGVSFVLISLAYVLWALINIFVVSELNEGIRTLSLSQITAFSLIGVHSYMLLYTIGLLTLVFVTLKTNNLKTYLVSVLLLVIAILTSANKSVTFHLISVVLLFFMIYHFGSEYKRNKNPKTAAVMIAFVLLVFSHADLFLSTRNYVFYVIGHVFELAAYIIISISLAFTLKHALKNEQKKK